MNKKYGDNLSDVKIKNPSIKQYLSFNGTEWVNNNILLDNLDDIKITYPIKPKSILYYDGKKWVNSEYIFKIKTDNGTINVNVNKTINLTSDFVNISGNNDTINITGPTDFSEYLKSMAKSSLASARSRIATQISRLPVLRGRATHRTASAPPGILQST